jgi:hypothetical protein
MSRWIAGTIATAALFLGSCQNTQVTVNPPVEKSYVIPYTLDPSGMMVVTADLTIAPSTTLTKRLVIDTGAAHTCYFASEEDIAKLIKTVPGAADDMCLSSNGQVVNTCRFTSARLTIGGLTVDVPIYASAYDMGRTQAFDGAIGNEFLSRFIVTIDYQAKTLTLTHR